MESDHEQLNNFLAPTQLGYGYRLCDVGRRGFLFGDDELTGTLRANSLRSIDLYPLLRRKRLVRG